MTGHDPNTGRKTRAAALSILSNSLLIALKLVAGAITGSIAIITEAIHSSVDLIASIVAFVSVRKAGEPADEDHPYGHDKIENLAAVIEGQLRPWCRTVRVHVRVDDSGEPAVEVGP